MSMELSTPSAGSANASDEEHEGCEGHTGGLPAAATIPLLLPRRGQSLESGASPTPLGGSGSPFALPLPPPPEGFAAPQVDVWNVLQLVERRRLVIVCGDRATEPGVGKTTVLQQVQRDFELHKGGTCVAVDLKSCKLTERSDESWIQAACDAVRLAIQERRERWGLYSRMSGRSKQEEGVPAIFKLFGELEMLYEVRRKWPAAIGKVLLLLDSCDDYARHHHFQANVAAICEKCFFVNVVLGCHRPVVDTLNGKFKFTDYAIKGLAPDAASKLFLNRLRRPLIWEELPASAPGACRRRAMERARVSSLAAPVRSWQDADVLKLIAGFLADAGCSSNCERPHFNPRRVIELANDASRPL